MSKTGYNLDSLKNVSKSCLEVLRTDVILEDIPDATKFKSAVETRIVSFKSCKDCVSLVLQLDPIKSQSWARDTLSELLELGGSAVNTLNDALNQEISLEEEGIVEDGGSINTEVKTRVSVANDIVELQKQMRDIEEVLEKDYIKIDESDFTEGYAEKYAEEYIKMGNKSGYREDLDAVVIDPDGTVGDIIEIMGLKIVLPTPPKKQPWNYKYNKERQCWTREGPPKEMNKKNAHQKEYQKFIHKEYMRKRNGMWFLNNGNLEYVTGAHWFLMTHFKTGCDGNFYYFTKAQQKLFLFMEACWCDQRCYGMILEKIRRFGATDSLMAFNLCKSITTKDGKYGMTSKTKDDAADNFTRLADAFSNLPFYLKPICRSDESKSKLEYKKPIEKNSKTNKDKDKVDNSLNTYFDYKPTKASSYDGTALNGYIVDEFSKWEKMAGDIIKHWEMVKVALTKGSRIIGKAFIISTVENVTGSDPYDEKAKSGDKYKYLYYNSDINNRNNDRTKTGLYRLFISTYEHFEGYIDKYGYALTEDPIYPVETVDGIIRKTGIKTFINNELLARQGNPKEVFEYLRKFPCKEEDGFQVAEGICLFNQANILLQKAYIQNQTVQKENDDLPPQIRKGNFHWKDGIRDTEVYWKDNPDGRFLITWMPPEELQNSCYREYNVKKPGNEDIGAFGVDPYRVNKTVEGKGSKGAMHGLTRPNACNVEANMFFLEYIARPDTREIFEEDMIMAMVFYGMPALIENNVNNLLEKMHKRGYSGYSLRRVDKPKSKLSYDELTFGGQPGTGENFIQMQNSALEDYIEKYIGYTGEDSEYYPMYFERTLNDWLQYDPTNRTKRDASISSSLAILACRNMQTKPKSNYEAQREGISKIVPMYNNKGNHGTRINTNRYHDR